MANRETDSKVCLRTPHRVLIYDALQHSDQLAHAISMYNYEVETASDLKTALAQFEQRDFPLVLIRTDERGTGLDFVKYAHMPHNCAFIAVTPCAGRESAIYSLRAGVRDYIVWPSHEEEVKHALNRVFDEVEHTRFREDMLSMLTHDIKIPLSSILGYSSLIFDKKTGQMHDRGRDYVKIINSNGLKILSLIDNFLTTSKIDSGKLHLCLNDIDLRTFLSDIASTFQAELDRHKLQLSIDVEHNIPCIEADESLLFRAVGNLLSNACKFSPEGTRVTMAVRKSSLISTNGETVPGIAIQVSNEGPGIDVSEIPEIFERFRRGHAQGSIEGSGLGAFVVKSIAEAHRGTVKVESTPNRLTTFSICLPLHVL